MTEAQAVYNSRPELAPLPDAIKILAAIHQKTRIQIAFEILSEVMQTEPDYAWSWQCNLAMMAHDAGAPAREANIRAADLIHSFFKVDVKSTRFYQDLMAEAAPGTYTFEQKQLAELKEATGDLIAVVADLAVDHPDIDLSNLNQVISTFQEAWHHPGELRPKAVPVSV